MGTLHDTWLFAALHVPLLAEVLTTSSWPSIVSRTSTVLAVVLLLKTESV
jgi:hypothetical protein